jgi:lysophospholipase L1-like esterase
MKTARKIKLQNLLAAFFWLCISCNETIAQQKPVGKTLDSFLLKYPFVRIDQNKIVNDSLYLNAFYEKLWELKTGKRDRVTIVQIGDSHIQADVFSGTVRKSMQLNFGNAGRGLVFPYRVAKSNGPPSYKSSSSLNNWISKRAVFLNDPLPIGVSGFTIATTDTNAFVQIRVNDEGELDYGFNKLTLFHSKGPGFYDFSVCDEYNCSLGYFDAMLGDSNISSLEFKTPMHTFMLNCMPHDTSGKRAEIYGILLENGKPGVLYNMIGVNGAMYYHYNNSAYFLEQFAYLKPDLIIVSLGTNEGYANGFKPDFIQKNMDSLISKLKQTIPESQFIITTPGDSFKRTRKGYVKNPNMQEARNTVVNYCTVNKLPYWDLFEVMGGFGSMGKWFTTGLAAKDRLHFTNPGYELQGQLLSDAMLKGYENYVLLNHVK